MKWVEQTAQGQPYDQAAIELALSVAAIHTTSDTQTFDLCRSENVTQELRQEIVGPFSRNMGNPALYKLQLMDS
jgi:hypothetical protein